MREKYLKSSGVAQQTQQKTMMGSTFWGGSGFVHPWLLLVLALCSHAAMAAGPTNSVPKSLRWEASTGGKLLVGVGGVGALALGKSLYDGPVFAEDVDLTGKVIAITGANTGLGYEAAMKLASLGKPEIILLCRSEKKAAKAAAEIIAATGNSNVKTVMLDLNDLASVSSAASELKRMVKKIDVLQLNSGVMAVPTLEKTQDGFEMHLGINHLGHFALTRELFPLLVNAKQARVVVVSSTAHLIGKIDKSNLMFQQPGSYSPWPAYGQSKLANILFAKELNRRLAITGNPSGVISVSLHPGVCRTELGRYLFDPESIPNFLTPVLGVVGAPALYLTKDARMGAQTQIFLSASSKISPSSGGLYFDNSREAAVSPAANNEEDARWLWAESERLTGGTFRV